MYGFSAVQSTVRTIEITTKPPQSGPGFDGLDADGDGGVTYQEFWTAADQTRNGGTMTITSSVARTSIQAATIETPTDPNARISARLSELNVGFDAAAEFERALAAVTLSGAHVASASIEVEADAGLEGAEPMDSETADLRARALEAASGPVETGLPSLDPFERAAERIFGVADSDRDGVMSRSEFDAMKNALFGGGRTVESRITSTASEGYALSATASGPLPGYVGLTR